ncbi:PAS domain S-box protein [Candidatus Desantisbacteria bacterium]|nr:PAS domain S-box protein [Candidatus Desantisbacteria bacterium]
MKAKMIIFDKFFYRIKIRYKLLTTFIVITIIPLLILGIAYDIIFSPNDHEQFLFIIIILSVLIISIILAISASRHFDKAIQTICLGADMLSKGNLNYRIELKTHDEMEDIAAALNSMSFKLKIFNDELELKIQAATAELQNEKQKFESILMGLGEGLIIADKEDRVFLINSMAEKILGINHVDIIGKNYHFCHKKINEIQALVNLSEKKPIERILEFKEKTIRVNVASIKSSQKKLAIAMIMHDITEEKELEKQKHDFVSMITHDIKSPLTAILGFSSLLLTHYNEKMDKRIYDSITTINNSGKKILYMVDDFLLSSKLEAGYLIMDMKPVRIDKIIDDLIPTFNAQLEEKNLTLNYSYEKDLPEILGDAVQIDRVFSNLINNAIKFTPSKGTINIYGKYIIDGGERYIEISIGDTGIGIPENEIENIFNKYSTSRDSAKHKGTGLGLYISKMIIEAHNGKISFTSKEGEGTTFYIKFKCK